MGDGTGTIDAIGDYSVTPLILKIKPTPPEILYIHNLSFVILDGNIDQLMRYGGLAGPLTNGITSTLIRGDGYPNTELVVPPIKANSDFAYLADGGFQLTETAGGDMLLVSVDLKQIYGRPVLLDSARFEEWQWVFNDNFTGLNQNGIMAAGHSNVWR